MTLLNPWALWFLPLAAIPVLIHLFRQRQVATTPFPDIRFLKQSQTEAWRKTRIREWLLLALRILAILLMVLAVARPRVGASLPRWLGGSEGSVIIILDDSASMGARDGTGTLFDRAKAKADEILNRMSGNSRAAVISASDGNRIICGLVDPARARQRATGRAPSDLGTNIPGAIAAADRIAAQTGKSAEIVLISDLQRSGFGELNPLPALPAGVSLTIADVPAARPPANLVWDKVTTSALRLRIIVEGRLQGRQQTVVRLERNGRVMYSQPVGADAQGQFTASFGWPDADSLTLTCDGDDLPADDVYYLPARAKRSSILLVADSVGSEYVASALAAMAGDGFDLVRSSNPLAEQWERAEAIVYCRRQASRGMADRLLERRQAGAAVLVLPPPGADVLSYDTSLLPRLGEGELLALARSDPKGLPFRLSAGPAIGLLSEGLDERALGAAEISAYWQIRGGGPRALEVAGLPVLTLHDRTALWLFGAAPDMNTLVFKPVFVVLLHRVLRRLLDNGGGQVFTGAAVKQSPGMALAGPNGAPAGRDEASGAFVLSQRGWYERTGLDRATLMAVNIPPRESELAMISGAELKLVFHNMPVSRTGLAAGRSSPLEWLLLLLALLVLSLEMLVRSR